MNSKQQTTDIFKIKPNKFILGMCKNGLLKNNEIEILKDQINTLGIESLDINTSKIAKLFIKLNKYNINYIYYILIFKSISSQQLKNLYRFILIKWNIVRQKMDHLKNIEIKYKLEDIIIHNEYEYLLNILTESFMEFSEKGEFFFLFFINSFHEYLYPNTNISI